VSVRESYPAWCRCHEAYRIRNLVDPSCPHEEFEDVAALLDALDANGADVLVDLVVRNAYNNVAAFIRPKSLPRIVMFRHDLDPDTLEAEDEREVTWRARCKVCGLSWRSLTTRDLRVLTEESWCLGRPERWHRCQYSGAHCVGEDGHESCVPLVTSGGDGT